MTETLQGAKSLLEGKETWASQYTFVESFLIQQINFEFFIVRQYPKFKKDSPQSKTCPPHPHPPRLQIVKAISLLSRKDLILEVGRSGQTKIHWLHEVDLARLRALSILELDIIFSEYNIHHSWRKRNKRRKVKEGQSSQSISP